VKSALLLALPVILVGCAASPAATPAPSMAPVSLENCGFDVTVTQQPQRIVTIKSTSTELVIALGLGDRIVGEAFADGPLPTSLPQVDVPLLSERAPSEEAVLDLEPDLVVAGWESNFTAEAAGERAELRDLGIATYVSPAACKGEYQPTSLGFDDLFGYIAEAGTLLGANDAATALIAEQQKQLAAIEQNDDGLSALWWSSGTDTPYVGAGIGAPQLMLDTVGLSNIASDIADTWSPFNWEAVIAANPDVIVLVDASWNTADSKKAYLASNPATATLDAVKNERYLIVPFAAGEAGVRTVEATASLAEQLADLP
jgi:iron complex transport system substrate-binding protein